MSAGATTPPPTVTSMMVSLNGRAATLPVESTNPTAAAGGVDPTEVAFCAHAALCPAIPAAMPAAITHLVMAKSPLAGNDTAGRWQCAIPLCCAFVFHRGTHGPRPDPTDSPIVCGSLPYYARREIPTEGFRSGRHRAVEGRRQAARAAGAAGRQGSAGGAAEQALRAR